MPAVHLTCGRSNVQGAARATYVMSKSITHLSACWHPNVVASGVGPDRGGGVGSQPEPEAGPFGPEPESWTLL